MRLFHAMRLRNKGYTIGQLTKGIGSDRIEVVKCFGEADRDVQLGQRGAPGCVSRAKEAHWDASY